MLGVAHSRQPRLLKNKLNYFRVSILSGLINIIKERSYKLIASKSKNTEQGWANPNESL